MHTPQLQGTVSATPPRMTWMMEGIEQIDIVSCSLQIVPSEVGRLKSLKSLVLISCELRSLPAEVGDLIHLAQVFLNGNFLERLPLCFGALPGLTEVCLDANLLKVLPPFATTKMKLFTAPCNQLTKPPLFAGSGALERLELHGNDLSELDDGKRVNGGTYLSSLKVMGNRLRILSPQLISQTRWLCYLSLGDNLLRSLPQEVAALTRLEVLMVYNNNLSTLPSGILTGSKRLKQVLLEGNPLSSDALEALMREIPRSTVSTLALDEFQADMLLASRDPNLRLGVLAACVTVGNLVRFWSQCRSSGMYLKLTRASQLRRKDGVAVAGSPGGPPRAADAPTKVLVVAFAASQGEPEWLGLLRDIAGPGHAAMAARRYPSPEESLAVHLGESMAARGDPRFASMWEKASDADMEPDRFDVDLAAEIFDFDILCVCDARMRWYCEDSAALQQTLKGVCERYEKTLFIGASMGGYGALLHGGHLADMVVAFGPQALLQTATLRPCAPTVDDLKKMHEHVTSSVLAARRRGARVEVHAAADTHLEHAMSLPLDHLALTVHPLCPRTPFARLLDRVGVLWPVVATAVASLQGSAPQPAASQLAPSMRARVSVARWRTDGCQRHGCSREDALEFFFGDGAPNLPRPGDWFCARCSNRSQKAQFCCTTCGKQCRTNEEWAVVPTVADLDTRRVPHQGYPHRGDWGCGVCGKANLSRDKRCSCGVLLADPRNFIV